LDQALSWIVEAAVNNRHKQFVIDGEAVILGVDGISTRWILQGTMMQYSSMLSIFWRSAAMTCAPSPCRCASRIWLDS
jgi:hypothetical protein